MSARESSRAPYGAAEFTRWRALLGLTLGWLAGPVIALLNQQFIYMVNMWACGRNTGATMHIVPALCLIATIGCGITAHRDWKRVGAGVEEEAGGVAARTRFIAIGGMSVSAFSALVIIAQWVAIFFFDPCMRA